MKRITNEINKYARTVSFLRITARNPLCPVLVKCNVQGGGHVHFLKCAPNDSYVHFGSIYLINKYHQKRS